MHVFMLNFVYLYSRVKKANYVQRIYLFLKVLVKKALFVIKTKKLTAIRNT